MHNASSHILEAATFIVLQAVIWAQAIHNDPLSGGSGWVGAGLLGLVLAWLLLKHLPEKDKQYKELIEAHKEEMRATRAEFRDELTTERKLRQEQTQAVLQALHAVERLSDHIERLPEAVATEINGMASRSCKNFEFADKDQLTQDKKPQ